MTSVVRSVFAVLLFFVSCGLSAQTSHHTFERFADELGGRQSSVYDIFRDKKGFLWFAGDTDGLLRYDGYQLIRWSGQGEEALGRVSYSAVLMSNDEQLWAAAWGSGLLLWQPEQRRFQVFNTTNSELPDNRAQTLYEDKFGTVWAGTLSGLVSVSPESSKGNASQVRRLPAENPLHQERIWRMAELDGMLWVATTAGLYRMSYDGSEWQQFAPFSDRLGNNRINEIRTVRTIEDRLWVGIDGGLFEFDVTNETFILVEFPSGQRERTHPQVNTLYPHTDERIWVGTQTGLFLVDSSTHEYSVQENGSFISAADVDIRRITSDTNGALWLGTRDQGIFYSNTRSEDFRTHLKQAPEQINELIQRNISAVYVAPNDDLWIGVPNGVVRQQNATGEWQYWEFPADRASRRTETVFTDHTGRTWIASNNSLYFIEPDGKQLQHANYVLDGLGIDATAVTTMYEDSNGRLWFGFWGRGLAYYDSTRDEAPQLGWDFTDFDEFRGDLVYDLLEIPGSGLWMVNRFSGLFHKPEYSDHWRPYSELAEQNGWPQLLPQDGLLCLFSSDRNALWLCSEQGLIYLNIITGEMRLFRRADGLPSDRILGIRSAPGIESTGGEALWITTSRGISLYEPEHQQFLNFGLADGLPAMEFIRAAIDVSSNGHVFAGTVRGAVDFHPGTLVIDRTPPKVGLSRLWVNDEDITEQLHFFEPRLTLGRDHRSMVVQFSVLDFKRVSHNTGRYRLLGLNNEWSPWSELRQLTFTTLPPGQYTLEIEGRNSLGIVSDQPLRIGLTVERPWWESPWFWLFAGLLLVALIVAFAQLRFAALARMNRRLDQQVQERTHELEALALKLREQSQTDYLTKLPNRRGFTEKFDWVIAHAKRHDKPLSLILFDVDHFKRFNDDYGHEAGDQVLIALSDLLRARLREQDVMGRWGGEEFAILLPDTPLKGALKVCESLRAALEDMRVEHNEHSLKVTATFGVYEGKISDAAIEHWMQCADAALYRGKELGRNRVTQYHPET